MATIITTTELAPWVRPSKEQLDEHPLAQAVLAQASLLVNEAVWRAKEESYWDLTTRPAPQAAKDIAVQLSARVFSNPRVVQQRSTGPMSERIADVVLTGMALRPDEVERLRDLYATQSKGNGLWILRTMPDTGPKAPPLSPYVVAYQDHPASILETPWEYHGA